MTQYIITNSVIIITTISLGIFVFHKDKKAVINRTFLLLNLSIAIWAFGFMETIIATNKEHALFWGRALYVGAIFIPVFFSHFILAFLNEAGKAKKKLIIAYVLSGIFLVINCTPWLIKDVTSVPPFRYYDVPGSLYPFFVLFFFGQIFYAHYKLIKVLRSSIGRKRNQIKYILVASALAFSGGAFAFLPVYGINIPPIGNYLIALYPIIISYTIIQHRLMDISIVFRKGTVNTFLLALVIIPSLLIIIWMEKLLLGSINVTFSSIVLLFFLTGIFLFPRARPEFEEMVDRFIFKDKYQYQRTLSELSNAMVSILDLNTLSQKIVDTITQEMQVLGASLFIFDREKEYYYTAALAGPGSDSIKEAHLMTDNSLLKWARVKKKDLIIKEELRWDKGNQNIIESMDTLQAEITFPLIWKGELIGLLNLNRKISGEMYSYEDLDLLKTIANQATIAIENSLMYEALRRTNARMQRADRLASLGTLTAGLAHEIRSPLVAIKTFLQLLPEKLDDEEFRNYFLTIATGEANKISSLITELLDFARPSEPQLQGENVNEIVEKMLTLAATETNKKNLKIAKRLVTNLPLILIDKDQIKQALLNIILNAVEASPENGEIFIETDLHSRKNEKFIQVKIRDTGAGIFPQEIKHIFTPFYTTKAQGSGLGLSIAYQIIEGHHGHIDVESKRGEGTTIFINLPLN